MLFKHPLKLQNKDAEAIVFKQYFQRRNRCGLKARYFLVLTEQYSNRLGYEQSVIVGVSQSKFVLLLARTLP